MIIGKLGRKPVRLDPRTLKLSKYLKAKLPPTPDEVSWITKLTAALPLPMYLNDSIGDCVEAAAGHMIEQWNFYAGHPQQPSDQDILKAYSDVSGYVPGDPSTDNGTDMLSFLKYWRKVGVGGHKIRAFVTVNWLNDDEIRAAILYFGNLYIGVALPTSAQGQSSWTVPDGGTESSAGGPGSWGGHCIPVVAASPITRTCITWGETLKMSHNFLEDYCEEAYAVLSDEWLTATGLSASGVDMFTLQADLLDITDTKSAEPAK